MTETFAETIAGAPPVLRDGTAGTDADGRRMLASQRGAWGEAVATVWLIDHGYEVFQGVGNTSCDFVALRDGKTYRVEVKTCLNTKPGVKPGISGVYPERFDLLLVVLGPNAVLANPTPDEVAGAHGTLKLGRGRRKTVSERYS